MPEKVTAWKTQDGKYFEDENAAKQHDKAIFRKKYEDRVRFEIVEDIIMKECHVTSHPGTVPLTMKIFPKLYIIFQELFEEQRGE